MGVRSNSCMAAGMRRRGGEMGCGGRRDLSFARGGAPGKKRRWLNSGAATGDHRKYRDGTALSRAAQAHNMLGGHS